MSTIRHWILIGATLLIGVGCAVLPFKSDRQEVAFYVSTDGNDSWSGARPDPNRQKSDGPFATLDRARDAVHTAK
ncbi:MAG: hypothetical protein ABIH23_29580 [bacterium]